MTNKKILIEDPDDLSGQRMITLHEWWDKVNKMNLYEDPLFFNGCVVDTDNKELMDYMFEIEYRATKGYKKC